MEVSQSWGYPKSSKSLDRFGIEIDGFGMVLGILHFKKPHGPYMIQHENNQHQTKVMITIKIQCSLTNMPTTMFGPG